MLREKWRQMEAYGFDSPSKVFARLAAVEAERDLYRRSLRALLVAQVLALAALIIIMGFR